MAIQRHITLSEVDVPWIATSAPDRRAHAPESRDAHVSCLMSAHEAAPTPSRRSHSALESEFGVHFWPSENDSAFVDGMGGSRLMC